MYLFYIISDYFAEALMALDRIVKEIYKNIVSVNHTRSNRRRPTGSKGRWQKAISVQPSRAGPLPRDKI